MIINLYYISCTYVKPMNCMVLGNKQYNTNIHKENAKQITMSTQLNESNGLWSNTLFRILRFRTMNK